MMRRHLPHWPPDLPRQINVPQVAVPTNLALSADRAPDHTAVLYYGAAITYGTLWADVERLAGWLQSRGVTRGDRVLLYMQNAPQWIIAYFAIQRADACVIPVNPMNRQAELEHLARDTDAKIAIAGSELIDQLRPLVANGHLDHVLGAAYADMSGDLPLPAGLGAETEAQITGPGITRWSQALSENRQPAPQQAGAEDLAVIPYSSGTTGNPKGCVHRHKSVQHTTHAYVAWSGYDSDQIVLSSLPYFHVTGMQSGMNAPLAGGATIVLMTRWDRDLAAKMIARHKVTMWRSITTMVIDFLGAPDFDQFDLQSLTMITAGGAQMPAAIAQKLLDKTGIEVIEGYGLSESIAASHINPGHAPRMQCLGIPWYDMDSRVIDPETGTELGPNEPGEILLHGPQVFDGYWRNPQATDEAFITIDDKAFFRTGDIGLYDEDGFFYMTDRLKRMINASGFKVWPTEVEALMLHHPAIAEACIIGVPDPRRGESVRAYLVTSQETDANPDAKEIIEWCHNNMAAYKCPRSIIFVDELPKSGSGKVLWRELMEREAQKTGNLRETGT